MAKYKRRKQDDYPSPPWVIDALLPFHEPRGGVWECAAGKKRMLVEPLKNRGYSVVASDISDQISKDFMEVLTMPFVHGNQCQTILTNPPYDIKIVDKFIEHALKLASHRMIGKVMLLLRVEFDCAKTRKKLFANHPNYVGKVVLTRRLVIPGFKYRAAPMKHHAWYVWDFAKRSKVKRIDYA